MKNFTIGFMPEHQNQKLLRQKAVKFLEELAENDLIVDISVRYEDIHYSKIKGIAKKHDLPFYNLNEILPNTEK